MMAERSATITGTGEGGVFFWLSLWFQWRFAARDAATKRSVVVVEVVAVQWMDFAHQSSMDASPDRKHPISVWPGLIDDMT
jgi:hypothetical protein